jgi:uncharacterized tellurite resistance protein B-like protein
VAATPENKAVFERVCAERKLTWADVVSMVMKYAQEKARNTRDVFATASNLRKELAREKINEKVLRKGLMAIGLGDDEINNMLT